MRRRVPDLRVAAVMVQHVHEAIGDDHDFGERIVVEVRDRHVAVDAVGSLPDLRELTVDKPIGGRSGDDLRDAVQIHVADRGDGRTAAGAGGRASERAAVTHQLPIGIKDRAADDDVRSAAAGRDWQSIWRRRRVSTFRQAGTAASDWRR